MSETAKLMELLQQQMQIQREQTEAQIHAHAKLTEAIIATLTGGAAKWADSTPKSFLASSLSTQRQSSGRITGPASRHSSRLIQYQTTRRHRSF